MTFLIKSRKSPAVKHSIKTLISFNLVNMFTTFFPGLSEKNRDSFVTWSRLLDFKFSENVKLSKDRFCFKIHIWGNLVAAKS